MNARDVTHRIVLVLAAAIVLAGGAMLVAAFLRGTIGSKELARQLSTISTQTLFDPATTRLEIGDVRGNPLSGLVLTDVRLETRSVAHPEWTTVATAKRIATRHRPADLARGTIHIRALHIEEPTLVLPRAGDRWPMIRRRGAPAGDGAPRAPLAIRVDQLLVRGAHVHADSTAMPRLATIGLTDLDADLVAQVEVHGSQVTAKLDSLLLRAPGRPPITVRGEVGHEEGRIALSDLVVTTPESHLWLDGNLAREEGATLTAELDPLTFAEAHALTRAAWLDRPGWVRGKVTAEGPWSALDLRSDLFAVVGPDTVEHFSMRGRVSPTSVDIAQLSLTLEGVPYRGSGWVGLGAESYRSHGRVTFDHVILQSLPGLRGRADIPRGHLSGTLAISAEQRTPAGPMRPFRLEVSRGEIAGIQILGGLFAGQIGRNGTLELETTSFSTHGAEVTGSARLDQQSIALNQSVAVSSLRALAGMFGEERFDGRGNLDVAIEGPLAAPGFTAQGTFDSLRAGPALLGQVELAIADGVLRPELAFAVDLDARGGEVAGVTVDSVAFHGAYAGGVMEIEEFAAARGRASIAAVGSASLAHDVSTLELTTLDLALGEDRLRNVDPLRVEWRGQRIDFDAFKLAGEGGRVEISGVLDPKGTSTQLDMHVAEVDLAKFHWLPSLGEIAGRIDMRLSARGAAVNGGMGGGVAGAGGLGATHVTLDLEADSLDVRGFTTERAEVSVVARGDTLILNRVMLTRGGTVTLEGWAALPPNPSEGLGRIRSPEVRAASQVDLTVRADDLDLTDWHGLDPRLDQVTGAIDLLLQVRGPAAAPNGTLALKADSLRVGEEPIGPLDVEAELSAGRLFLRRALAHPAGAPITISGPAPVAVSLVAPPVLDRTAPLDLRIDVTGASLGIARYFHGRVAEAEGELLGQVEVRGTVDEPELYGRIEIAGGHLTVRGRDEVLDRIVGEVLLEGKTVRLVNVTATDGDEGHFTAEGVVILKGYKAYGYDLTAVMTNFQTGVPGDYQGEVDATLTAQKNMGGAGALSEYTGKIRVRRLDYLRELVGRARPEEPGPSSWIGTFTIEMPRNVWIRNTDLEAELKGLVTYERTLTGNVVLGEMETIRGRYDLFGHTFRITQGEINFRDTERIDPDVNVSAETRIPEARIFATITGRATDRQVMLTSDPDYDQATIWKLLVPSDPNEVTSLLALTPVVQEIERALSRQIPGLSLQVETRTTEGAEEGTLGARVGTYVVPELFISAYQGISSGTEQDVSVEYGLSDIAFVKGSVVRRGVTTGVSGKDVLEEYNIDLNLRWEF